MFFKRHRSRIISAAVLLALFLFIGGAAWPEAEEETPAPSAPAIELKAPPAEPSTLPSREQTTPSPLPSAEPEAEAETEAAPEIEIEVVPEAEAEAEVEAEVGEETAAPVPYLTYYEHGHFKPGENGVLITAEGEELRYSSVLEVSATAYTTERQENKITATGTVAHVGGIAVDPTVIPYGTRMYIVSKAGAWAYGYAVAEDCGGGIKGNKIDLFFDTYDECIEFGVRNALVYILED